MTQQDTPCQNGNIANAKQTVALLDELLLAIVRDRQPQAVDIVQGKAAIPVGKRDLLLSSLQAIGIRFQLLNIAEENADMRRRRSIETERGPDQVPGTFAHVLANAAQDGIPAQAIAALIESARVCPVITAHPTEAKRVTVLEIHRRIYLLLMQLESERWTAREREDLIDDLRNEIDLLWITGELRLTKPTVEQEVAWGLHFFNETLFERTPELLRKLDLSLQEYYPGHRFNVRPFFQFGSWVGGDRDGNPFVTKEVTRTTLNQNRLASLYRYRQQLRVLSRRLSVAAHSVEIPSSFQQTLNATLEQSGDGKVIAERNPGEVFRQFCVCMLKKLDGTIAAAENDDIPEDGFSYRFSSELVADLQAMIDGLQGAHCGAIAKDLVLPVQREVEVFGFRTVSLDLRQNTTVTNATLEAIWTEITGEDEKVRPSLDSDTWKQWVISELERPLGGERIFSELPEMAQATFDLLRMVRETRERLDPQALGGLVLSMTQSAADVLGVYLLAKYAGLFTGAKGEKACVMMVVPLFETIDDLRAAPTIMQELLSVPLVKRTVQALGGVQEVMIGYSDSNKDGGFLCSNWKLSQAQSQLTQVGKTMGIPISFFHGRGGSVSRGGAPTGRAIAAQPAGSVQGRMRVTEQGEVVSSKFANRGTASYNMELLAASVIEHTLKSGREEELKPHPEFDTAMESLSEKAYAAYRRLAEYPGLVTYYEAASPVEELTLLNIGSRPARRFGASSLTDLRAIPWVFAWTQNRHLVPGWYGIGSALDGFLKERGPAGEALLARMFQGSRVFKLVIDEAEKTLSKVDLALAKEYADLVPDPALRDEIFGLINDEYQRSVDQVLRITGSHQLLDRFPQLKRRQDWRLKTINQVGHVQVQLIKSFRAKAKDDDSRRQELIPLLLSINCIATGLGWTG